MDFQTMDELKKQQEDVETKKGMYNAFADAADQMANTRTAGERYFDLKSNKVTPGDSMRSLASGMADPIERQKKLLADYQAIKQSKRTDEEMDPNSEINQKFRQAAKMGLGKYGSMIPENITMSEFNKNFSTLTPLIKERMSQDAEMMKLAMQKNQGQRLPADKVIALSEAAQVPKLLDDMAATVKKNKDVYGPVSGRWASMNPWNETAKTVDAQTRTVRQTIGKLKEGGVLRKEDEEKYAKMLPQLSDTPEVAENKIALVRREMSRQFGDTMASLRNSGYDTSGINISFGDIPELPDAVKGSNMNGQKAFASGSELSQHDFEAAEWAKKNPTDPRSKSIIENLKRKGM
jgi:hypothetical protein